MYTIVTGYYGKDKAAADFFDLWWKNTNLYSQPEDIFVINACSSVLPEQRGKWIDLSFNLGHVHDLDLNNYPHKKFGGWSMSFILGAFLAYANGTDLIYKEQDCLAFNSWVEELYFHEKEIVVGQPQHAAGQSLEQSLFLIKHSAILEFTNAYVGLDGNDGGKGFIRPECKFAHLLKNKFSNRFAYSSMGYGRAKPTNLEESIKREPFYFQKLTAEEVATVLRS